MELLPIKETADDNIRYIQDPVCRETIFMTIEFYKKVGYTPPRICYYVKQNNQLVASAGFKGKPSNGTIEIAYGTFEKYRKQEIGTAICRLLVDLALKTEPAIRITARTLPEEKFFDKNPEEKQFHSYRSSQ